MAFLLRAAGRDLGKEEPIRGLGALGVEDGWEELQNFIFIKGLLLVLIIHRESCLTLCCLLYTSDAADD